MLLVEKEIYEKLCPSYQTVIQQLNEKYNVIAESDYVERLELLKEYFHCYLMLPDIWDKYVALLYNYKMSVAHLGSDAFGNVLGKTWVENDYGSKLCPYHLIEDKSSCRVPLKLLNKRPKYTYGNPHIGPFLIKEIEAAVICPQKGMDKTWRFYEEFSRDPIPKNVIKKYQNAQKLYEDIVKAENDQEKWFNFLIQCENKEYVCCNIEARLGKNIKNLQLWHLYFNYLKEDKCKTRLLHLYSRYCRYFLDDYKMKEEYKGAAKKYGSIKVFWKNAFDFEIYEKDINLIISNSGQLIILSDDSDKTDSVKPKHNNTKPSFASYKTQIFSLPKTVMAYIIENANPNILRKLQKLCKYFFILQPHPVCHKFLRVEEESDDLKFNGNSLQLPNNFYNKRNEIFNNKFILSNSFLVSKELFLSKIYQCHAKYIRLWSIHLGITIKEFTFLVEHGNVEVLQLSDAPIFNDDKSPVALEEILKLIPKIIEFEISTEPIYTTPQTFQILPMLKFVNKIQLFSLYYLTYFEPINFSEFLKKNFDSMGEVWVRFDPKMDANEAENWEKEVEADLIGHCWSGNETPMIRIFKPYE